MSWREHYCVQYIKDTSVCHLDMQEYCHEDVRGVGGKAPRVLNLGSAVVRSELGLSRTSRLLSHHAYPVNSELVWMRR